VASLVVSGFISVGLAATPLKWGAAVSVLVYFNMRMANNPQGNVDVSADGELSDELLGDVSGGAVVGTPLVAADPPDPTLFPL
jgi:hypothetical protein